MTPLAGWRAGLVALALSTPMQAAAQLPEQVRIVWRDDASCPRPAALESDVLRLLGKRAEDMGEMELSVHVARAGSEYALTFVVDDLTRRAERRVQLGSCDEAREAAVLLIATSIDPTAALRPAPAPPTPPEPPPEAPSAATDAPPPPRADPLPEVRNERREARRRWLRGTRWSLLLGALGDLSALPNPSGGPLLGASFAGRRFTGRAQAHYLFPSTVTAGALQTELSIAAASLGAAYGWPLGPIRIGPGAELELGAIRAKNEGVGSEPSSVKRWGSALFGAAFALFPEARVGLDLGLFAGLRIWRPVLALRSPEVPLHTTERWSLRATVALRVSLSSSKE